MWPPLSNSRIVGISPFWLINVPLSPFIASNTLFSFTVGPNKTLPFISKIKLDVGIIT